MEAADIAEAVDGMLAVLEAAADGMLEVPEALEADGALAAAVMVDITTSFLLCKEIIVYLDFCGKCFLPKHRENAIQSISH